MSVSGFTTVNNSAEYTTYFTFKADMTNETITWYDFSKSPFAFYENLGNKPQIGGIELTGNKTLADLGIENNPTKIILLPLVSGRNHPLADYLEYKVLAEAYINQEMDNYSFILDCGSGIYAPIVHLQINYNSSTQIVKIILTYYVKNTSNTSGHFRVRYINVDMSASTISAIGNMNLNPDGLPTGGTTGQVLVKKSNLDNETEWADPVGGGSATGDTLPISSIMPYPKATPPENWLICDGSAISRTDYSELFNVIGTEFGEGDGSTTFNLPNIKGRTIVGLDPDDEDFNKIGKTLGEKAHKLTVLEMPEHLHDISTYSSEGIDASEWSIKSIYHTKEGSVSSTKTGGDQPHNNIQPSFVGCYIIKAKQSAGLVATVVDNLTSTSSTNALSARQGKVLNEKIETLTSQKVYSTEEKETGEIWLDGKTIYQKTITITDLNSNNTYSHGISNLSEVISVSGSAYFTTQKWQPLQRIFIDAVAEYSLGIGDITKSTFLMQVGSSYNGFTKAYVTIKYTKT